MKNIHLLPTENPSRLWYNNLSDTDELLLSIVEVETSNNQHIYITSDEEIKEGDFFYLYDIDVMFKCKRKGQATQDVKKIILTTDQDLIADGVQSIDDEFLEWFVKNPSCEEVEVNYIKTPSQIFIANDVPYGYYKIIIPQEEPNPFELPKALPDDVFFKSLEEPKQETFEEAAERLIINPTLEDKQVFKEGADWQAERMYSEKEVIDILYSFHKEENSRVVFSLSGITKWFEQFKKK